MYSFYGKVGHRVNFHLSCIDGLKSSLLNSKTFYTVLRISKYFYIYILVDALKSFEEVLSALYQGRVEKLLLKICYFPV